MFTDSYLNLLILQYRDLPKAEQTTIANITKYEELFKVIQEFEVQFDIDTAQGKQLDILGNIIGLSRMVPDVIPKVYFGFNELPNNGTFSESPFYNLEDDVLTDTELNDSDYRFFLKAKIAKNVTTARLIDDNLSIQDAIMFMLGTYSYVIDNQNMSMSLYVDDIYPERLLQYILALDLIPRPQGVKIDDVVFLINKDTFGFSENPNAKTFSEGKFAKIITI